VNAPGDGLRYAVNGVGLLPSHPYLDHAGFLLHQLADRLPPESPQARKFADAEVTLEGIALWHLLHNLPHSADTRYPLFLDVTTLERPDTFRCWLAYLDTGGPVPDIDKPFRADAAHLNSPAL
jgi:hypothetical protein